MIRSKDSHKWRISIKYPFHEAIQYFLSIYYVLGSVLHARGTKISKLEIVHVFLESIALPERSKPLSYQTSNSFKVLTNKTCPFRPKMFLFSRTLLLPPPPWDLSASQGASWHLLYFLLHKTFTYSRIGALLSNDRVASSRNPGLRGSSVEFRAVGVWNCSVPFLPIFLRMPKSKILFKEKKNMQI